MQLPNFLKIIDHLENSTAWHQVESFHLIPEVYQHALSEMVEEMEKENQLKAMIRFRLAHDVERIICGDLKELFCRKHLPDNITDTLGCSNGYYLLS